MYFKFGVDSFIWAESFSEKDLWIIPKAKEMAARIEAAANQMEQEGFELVSCSITPSSKGILVFRQIKAPQPTEVCEHEKG